MFPKKQGINLFKFSFSLATIIIFLNLIINAEFFKVNPMEKKIHASFIEGSESETNAINLQDADAIVINEQKDGPAVITYIAQRGDNLSSIAQKFGVTVSNLKKTNGLSSEKIKVGTKIAISEQPGIVYEVQEITNIQVFANKYDLNLKDLKDLNYIDDNSQQIYQGDELFIPISQEDAVKKGLLGVVENDDEPIKVAQQTKTPLAKQTAKPTTIKKPTANVRQIQAPAIADNDGSSSNKARIASKRVFNKKIVNGFSPGYCTWYAAIKRPDIFTFTSETRQDKKRHGNAIARYGNASKAGYAVGKTPKAGAIFVSEHSMPYGHVGIVVSVNQAEGTMVVEDMNYAGKYVVTRRTMNINDRKLVGYIY